MANVITYQDLFPSSTIMRQAPGNGTITVPGAGDARLVAPNGANCQFYVGDASGKAPILYESLSSMWQSAQPGQPLFLEAKLSAFTGTTNLRIAGISIFTGLPGFGSFYSYQMGWYRSDSKLHVWYDYPVGEVDLGSWAVADPATTPQIYRLHWNPYNRPMYIPELGGYLPTDYVNFSYSINNGVTWVSIYSRARDFSFNQAYAGIYCRKWETSAVNAQADFEYFQASQYNPTDQLYVPQIGRGNQDTAGLEDQGGLLTESGPPRFDLSDVGGDVVITPPAPVAFEDQGGLLSDGDRPRFDIPEILEAPAIPTQGLAIEEGLFIQLDFTDYINGKLDGDGKELAGGTAIRHVLFYDSTLEPWHTHGTGFHGAGRDGKLYYDGVECGPGSFGTLADGRRKTAWASNGDFVDVMTPGIGAGSYATSPTISADDELQCAIVASANGSGVSSRLRWFLTGDFDIQVDYEIVGTGAGPTDGGISLTAAMDRNNFTYCRRRMWGNFYDKNVYNNGAGGTYVQVATTDTSGKLRITRSGSNVSSFYWTGSAWAQIGATVSMTHTKPMYVDCNLIPYGGSVTATARLRNFTINSGATTNLIGWAREVAGTYRGSKADFPEHAVIISSGNSLDIIDADTDKLWMSFRGATNNFLGGDANYYVPQVVFKDGTLLLSYRTTDVAVLDGGGYWVDFTLDFMRLHRGPSYNDAGLIYNVELTGSVWPRDSANGAISWRNSARGFYASHYDNWQHQNMRTNWCDLLHYSGSQFRLIANNGGVYLAQWVRWRFEGSDNEHLNTPWYGLSTQIVAMRWAQFRPTSRDLLYHNRTKLWITSYATWNATMGGGGGTWLEDHEYSLGGSIDTYDRAALAQDSMALDDAGSKLYYARNQGVYVMDLTTGVSTLIYGKADSGATHEVLGEYSSISSVALTTDGATPLLLVGMARPDRIWAVNLTTNAIYWKGFQDDAHQPLSLAVGA